MFIERVREAVYILQGSQIRGTYVLLFASKLNLDFGYLCVVGNQKMVTKIVSIFRKTVLNEKQNFKNCCFRI